MKITDVTVTLFAWDDIPSTSYGSHTGRFSGSSNLGLVTIETDEGLEGHAFLGAAQRPATHDAGTITSVLKPLLLGQDPLARDRLWQAMSRMFRATTLRCIGAVDVALWDLAGKAAGMPLWRLMGGGRTSVPAYASSATLPSAQAYADEAAAFRDSGWHAYKIHPPTRWEEDIRVCEAVRRAVGDDYRLMLDAVWAYRFPEALRVGRAIQDLGFYWYEDPLAEDDIEGYVKLRQQLAIPLMATEYSPGGFTAYAPWITARATDYLRGDVAVKGGLTAMLKLAHLAEAFHMNVEVHHGGNSLNNVANLHLTCAISNCEYFEVLLPDEAQKYGLVQDIEIDARGMVHAPTAPGLGADIDFDLVRRKTVAVLD